MNTISIDIGGDGLEALQRVQDKQGAMAAAAKALDRENVFTVSHIQKDYLSFPRTGPTQSIGCRVITNRLRGSMRATQARIEGDTIKSSIGSNVKYAGIMEEGADFKRTQLAGSVQLRTDKKGNLLRNKRGGAIFAKGSHKLSTNVPFAGGKRFDVHIEGRHFTRRGINDRLKPTGEAMGRAIVQFWKGEGS